MRARLPSVRGTTARNELKRAITYVDDQRDLGRMEYVEAQKRNYPTGTGVTEAAGKTIVAVRMKRSHTASFTRNSGSSDGSVGV